MENKIDSVLSSESKADALLVEAREEGERKLNRVRNEIEEARGTLDAELATAHEHAIEKAHKAAVEEVATLQATEKTEADALRSLGTKRLEKARDLILDELLRDS